MTVIKKIKTALANTFSIKVTPRPPDKLRFTYDTSKSSLTTETLQSCKITFSKHYFAHMGISK